MNVKANKTALFGFLAKKITAVESEILTLYATLKDRVLVNTNPFTGELNGSRCRCRWSNFEFISHHPSIEKFRGITAALITLGASDP